ncbi:protein phosphatase 2C domain-containing protein [Streptomyces sp. H27-H5]|uniref:protein phosphatase 2C domain-containing protein n=1 Tax=Streptomyces sp. H27-H5 TaxID=2996460 RepID=UPI00226E70C4|nr:protein phosphatase 2C domain-containing protein [Streptomyces sp. H27-H5]MCY0958903.1 protein phosphatase 2C domain-containing protein [Streptomyces sp. H27-H5]
MSMHRPSGCPSCAEPLEEGDRFCGVCGYALSSPTASADPDPTLPITAPAPAPPGDAGAGRGAAGYPDGAPAPGWGSVAGAAPTLVGDPTGWAGAPARPAPDAPWGPGGTSYGASPEQQPNHAAAQGSSDGRGASYGAAGAPPEGAPWGAAEPPSGHPEPPVAPAGHPVGHPDPGHAAPAGPAPQGFGDAGERYDPPVPAPAAPASSAAPANPPGGDAGKTCVACRAGRVDTDGYCEHCGHAQPRERDHLEEELGSVVAVSDRGLRHHRNEDSFAVAATALPDGSAATVAIVCDGVSSASRPDEASAAAAGAANEALLEALPRGAHPQEAMHEAILAAAAAVNALAPEVPGAQNAPACTLVGAVVSGGLLTIGWVGDSRAYWVPDDRAALPRRLTEDDSWAAQMVAAGLMGEAEAYADARAHAITGWLGADAYDLEPHTASFKPDHPGVVVVCTDGLWNYAESARDLARILPRDAAVRPLHSAQVLVGHALDGGGHDNVTVAVVPFAALPEATPAAQPEPQAEADPRAQA